MQPRFLTSVQSGIVPFSSFLHFSFVFVPCSCFVKRPVSRSVTLQYTCKSREPRRTDEKSAGKKNVTLEGIKIKNNHTVDCAGANV